MEFKYSVNLVYSDEDECYVATIPEFPGLSAFGGTPEEAAAEARIAAEGFVEVFKEDGCQLPEPFKAQQFSGQTRLRMPKGLHASLSHQAQAEGVSLNQYIVCLLSERAAIDKLNHTVQDLKVSVLSAIFTRSPKSQLPATTGSAVFAMLKAENSWGAIKECNS